jgi:hypothetical protein
MLGAVWLVNGKCQSPVQISCLPRSRMVLSLVMMTWCSSNVALHPASQIFLMDTSELCVRPGMIWASLVTSGSWGSANVHVEGNQTMMGGLAVPSVG